MGRLLAACLAACAIGCSAADEEPPPVDGGMTATRPAAASPPTRPPRPCGDSLIDCELAMASHPGVTCENPLATAFVGCKLAAGFSLEGACRAPCTLMTSEQCDVCIEGSCNSERGRSRCGDGACSTAWEACLNDR
jgi:hypothetical protein